MSDKSTFSFGKSTIDWCEDNYTNSNYIAEYYNSLSSIFIALSGYIFNKIQTKNNEYRMNIYTNNFKKIYKYLLVTSIGTFLFHGTLFFPFQLLDELPMLFISLEYIRILLKFYKNNKNNLKFSIEKVVKYSNIAKSTIYFIPLSYYINHNLQILHFHIVLKIFESSILYMLYNLSNNCNKIAFIKISNQYKNKTLSLEKFQENITNYLQIKQKKQKYTKLGILIYSTSIFIWCIENLFCQYVKHYQLHAIWHMLSSLGIFYLNNIMLCFTEIDKLG